jgi:hypothetical protein
VQLAAQTPRETTGVIPDNFFEIDGKAFIPTAAGRGYWQKDTLSGAAAASLLGFAIERDHLEPDWIPVRLSIDMLRMPPSAPLTVATEVLHQSGRLRLVEARLMHQDRVLTRALCQILRPTEAPADPVWHSPPWPAPLPETLPSVLRYHRWDTRPIPPGHPRFARDMPEIETAASANPPVLGQMTPASARQTWVRPTLPPIAGHALTPFMRVVTTADFTSPLAHSSAHSIDYINTDLTLHLHRLPQGEWIGYELTGHGATDGVAVGQVAIHDLDGPIGMVVISAIANSRRV